MWYRDATLVEERIARLNDEARDARLQALARAHRGPQPGRVRAVAASAVRGLGMAALATAHWIDARTADQEPPNVNEIAWHHS
jgi:hypothetical protein